MNTLLGMIAGATLATVCFVSQGQANEWAPMPSQPIPLQSLKADSARIEAMPLCELRAYYLDCERRGIAHRLSVSDVPACSLAYEVLKHKAFAGDWVRLHAWARQSLALGPNFVAFHKGLPVCAGDPA